MLTTGRGGNVTRLRNATICRMKTYKPEFTMKRFFTVLLLGVGVALTHASTPIGQYITMEGFLDASAYVRDSDDDEHTLGLDEAEVDLDFKWREHLTGALDLSYRDRDGGNQFEIEELNFTWQFDNGLNVTGGKFETFLGWEAAESRDRYQYSLAYELVNSLPVFHRGLAVEYQRGIYTGGFAVLESLYESGLGIPKGDYAYEAMFEATPLEGLTVHAGYGFDQHDAFFSGALDHIAVLNGWVSYRRGKYTYALEYNDYTQERTGTADTVATQWLAMINYRWNERTAVTFRYSTESVPSGVNDEMTKITISPSYVFGERLLGVAEVSHLSFDNRDDDYLVAVQGILQF